MDGKGAWRDNVFVERLWRIIKYEEVYLHAYDGIGQAWQRYNAGCSRGSKQRWLAKQDRYHNGRNPKRLPVMMTALSDR